MVCCSPQVICVTYLPLMAYTILLRDLLAPTVEIALNRTLDSQARNVMVSALVALVRVLKGLDTYYRCSFQGRVLL